MVRAVRLHALAAAIALVAIAPAHADGVVVGQIACSNCWHEADRATVPYGGASDLACAARCAKEGIPPAIAVRDDDGRYRLAILSGDPPPPHASWLDLIGRFVRVASEPAADGAITAVSLEILAESPWPTTGGDGASLDTLAWTDLTGATQSFANLRGRIAVVNFWATWCKPCVEEMPVLAAVQSDYAALGVQTVGIAADAPGAATDVLAFVRRLRVSFPVWLGATTADMAALGVGPALPATVVLDRDGRVAHRIAGVVDGAELRAAIDRLIGSPTAAGTPVPEPGPRRVADAAEPGHRHRPGEASLVPS